MPAVLVHQFRNMVFRVYNEKGEPHNHPNVEVAYLGENRKKGRGKAHIANFIVPYKRTDSCYKDAGSLKSRKDEKLALQVLQTYRDKFLHDWKVMCSTTSKLPHKLIIEGRKEMSCGLVFWPVVRDDKRCVAVSYRGYSPFAVFSVETKEFLQSGILKAKHLYRAERIIEVNLDQWTFHDGWEEDWKTVGAGRPFSVRRGVAV